MRKLNLGFNLHSDASLEVYAQSIIKAMTGNSYFPDPLPELTAATTATTEFVAALSKAKMGGKNEVADKNQKRATLVMALFQLGSVAMAIAAGNVAALVSTGFTLTKERTPSAPLSKPVVLQLTDGQPGELKMTTKRVPAGRMYNFEYTTDPLNANAWVGQTTTQSSFTFKSLESGKKYWCRVAVMGVNEQVVYSDAVSRIAQ